MKIRCEMYFGVPVYTGIATIKYEESTKVMLETKYVKLLFGYRLIFRREPGGKWQYHGWYNCKKKGIN